MTNKEDSAFGFAVQFQEAGVYNHGLTKRELFASMVMQGIVANSRIGIDDDTPRLAVVLADKLIDELNKPKDENNTL